jgi:hypothetical protein
MKQTDKATRNVNVIFIVVFAALLLFPAVLIDTKGTVSEEEHRKLAEFPSIRTEDGQGNDRWQTEFSDYLYDRIGWRRPFISTASAIKLGAFRLSPNEMVHVGRDGWYFYTYENNIEIGRGAYLFSDDWLSIMAENQQDLRNYYREKGVPYYFMPVPGKPSVYPEFIGGGDFAPGLTLIDQVTQTLREKTDVPVVEVKDALLRNKEKGRLFLKQDFHWDALGSYSAYACILEEMNAGGTLKGAAPVSMRVEEADYGPGEVGGYFGNILPDEIAPDVIWERHSRQVTQGDYYDRIGELCRDADVPSRVQDHEIEILENPDAAYGTLLLYGDSQSLIARKLPLYLAEHFQTVVRIGKMDGPYAPLDAFVQPDAVLFERIERELSVLYTI